MHNGMNKKNNFEILSGSTLKLIAMIFMLIDHVGAILLPQYRFLRLLGRLSFPIFCFFIAEGAMHTRDINKYAFRLLLFALISEIPFDLAFNNQLFYWQAQNVFFTMFLGLLGIIWVKKRPDLWWASFVLLIVGEVLCVDYRAMGVMFVLLFYILYEQKYYRLFSFSFLNVIGYFGSSQMFASLSSLLLVMYNGQRGKNLKYVFYIFYPLHLLILYLIGIVFI